MRRARLDPDSHCVLLCGIKGMDGQSGKYKLIHCPVKSSRRRLMPHACLHVKYEAAAKRHLA